MSHTTFLGITAQTLYQEYKENIENCCMVFPSRRAALFFNRELSSLAVRDLWMPKAMGITQLVEQLSEQKTSNTYILLLELFKVYKKLTGKNESLEPFVFLGNTLLHDFDLADKYLLNTDAIFSNIKDLKKIEQDYSFLSTEQKKALASFWSAFQTYPEHPLNKHFISLWEILPSLYTEFKNTLKGKSLAYEGMLYRTMAEGLEDKESIAFINTYEQFVFIGFNALNPCEKKLFHFLKEKQKASFFWDYDPFYTEDTLQEAGMFLRENIKEFPSALDINQEDSMLSKDKNIQVLSVPSHIMQAKTVPRILKENNLPYNVQTAVVLADETLLMPLLYGLGAQAEQAESMNVTMGFPLSHTSLFSLIHLFLQYFFKAKEDKEATAVSMHPYVQTLDLSKFLESIPESSEQLHAVLIRILDLIENSAELTSADPILQAVIAETRVHINTLYLAVSESGIEVSPVVFSGFIKQQLSLTKIPFSGEPLSGLQIMGLLETRCLDFENVIIVSVQENTLPKNYREQSLIPYNLRKAFGLPAMEQHTAIQAYYFYRLLQRAKNIFLIHNSSPGSPFGGEISRFVHQISHELPGSTVTGRPLIFEYKLPKTNPLVIPKTGVTKDNLQDYLTGKTDKALSPTALLSYIRCPLQFFFKYIKGLKEPVFIPEQSDTQQIGNIVHNVLERMFRPLVGKTLTKEDLLHLIHPVEKVQPLIWQAAKGQELFSEIAALYINRYVKFDALQAPFKVLATEKQYVTSYQKVVIKGVIDRIDSREGNLCLIDYKTGTKKNSFQNVEDLFSSQKTQKNRDAFQILCYTFLYKRLESPAKLPVPILFYLNSLFTVPSDIAVMYNKTALTSHQDLVLLQERFLAHLDFLLKELFNFSVPFKQTDHIENCTTCPYISICQREKIND